MLIADDIERESVLFPEPTKSPILKQPSRKATPPLQTTPAAAAVTTGSSRTQPMVSVIVGRQKTQENITVSMPVPCESVFDLGDIDFLNVSRSSGTPENSTIGSGSGSQRITRSMSQSKSRSKGF